jgi:hypothetical protein
MISLALSNLFFSFRYENDYDGVMDCLGELFFFWHSALLFYNVNHIVNFELYLESSEKRERDF